MKIDSFWGNYTDDESAKITTRSQRSTMAMSLGSLHFHRTYILLDEVPSTKIVLVFPDYENK